MIPKTDLQIAFDKILGEQFRVIRKERHLSQEDMGKILSIHRQQYGKLECGKTTPIVYTLYSMLKALNVDIIQFMDTVVAEFEASTNKAKIAADQKAAKEYFKNVKKKRAQKNID